MEPSCCASKGSSLRAGFFVSRQHQNCLRLRHCPAMRAKQECDNTPYAGSRPVPVLVPITASSGPRSAVPRCAGNGARAGCTLCRVPIFQQLLLDRKLRLRWHDVEHRVCPARAKPVQRTSGVPPRQVGDVALLLSRHVRSALAGARVRGLGDPLCRKVEWHKGGLRDVAPGRSTGAGRGSRTGSGARHPPSCRVASLRCAARQRRGSRSSSTGSAGLARATVRPGRPAPPPRPARVALRSRGGRSRTTARRGRGCPLPGAAGRSTAPGCPRGRRRRPRSGRRPRRPCPRRRPG